MLATDAPVVDHFAIHPSIDPVVAFMTAFGMRAIEAGDRRFISLDVAAYEHVLFHPSDEDA